MSKKLSFLMLLMVLFAPWAANAQETLTVHNGTTTNNFVPVYGYYADAYLKCEMVYPASELGDMESGTITGMKFYASQSSVTWGSANFQVFLTEVGSTTISTFSGTGTTVYNGALSIINGEMNISFTTPYEYSGGNLLVGVYNTVEGDFVTSSWYGESVTGASYQGYSYSNLSSVSGSQRNFLPKTTFTYEDSGSSSCPRPTDLTVSNVTSNGATLTWNGSSDSYLVMVKESGQAEPTEYTYDFEDGTSQGWTTLKGSNGDSPNNWHHSTTHVSYDGTTGDLQDWSAFGHNSSSGFMISESYISSTSSGGTAYGAVTPDNYLVSPQVSLGGSISFYAGARNTSYCAEKFSVMVSTTNNTNIASFTTVQTWILSLDAAGYTTTPYTVDLSAYAGQTGYIAIRHWDCYDQWVLCIDDITINTGEESQWTTYPASASPFTINDLNPGTTYDVKVIGLCDGEESNASTTINFTTDIACPAPTNLNVSNITGHDATVTWTGNSESYIVNYRPSGHVEFINADFESGSLPDGWTIQGNNTWSVGTGDYNESTGAHDGNYNALITHNESDEETYLITKTMNLSGGDNLTLSLWYINRSWVGDTDGFGIYYRINGGAWNEIFATTAAHSGWTHFNETLPSGAYAANCQIGFKFTDNYGYGVGLDDIILEGIVETSEWQSVSTTDNVIMLTGLTSETLYEVVVQGDCGEEGMSATSEPVTFTTEVSCPAPTGLTVSDINGHGATVRWDRVADADHPTIYFQFVCVEHGETPDWTDAPVAIDRPTNPNPPTGFFSDLAPETEYDAYIRRICGTISPSGVIDGEFSAPAIITFTTTVTCPAPTDVTVSDITGHEATVTWTGSSESYIVKYRTAAYMDGIEESFDSGNLPSGWEQKTGLLSSIMEGTALTDSYQWYFGNQNGVFDYHARINIYGSSRYGWLITPETNVGNGFGISFDLALTAYSGTGAASGTCDDDRFVVLVYADNEWHILREWNNSGSSYVFNNIPTAGQNVSIDLSSYAGKTVKIAFYGESTTTGNGDNNLHIDNVTIGLPIAAGEWQTTTAEETTITLTGLTSETLYEVVVQGDCGDEGLSAESIPVTFTTDVSCPAPTDVTVSGITGHDATVTWTGHSDSYIVMIGTENLVSNVDFETGDLSQAEFTTTTNYPWTVVENTHSGAYCGKSGNGFTSTSSDLSLSVTLGNAATISFWAKVSSESGYDYGRFLIDNTQQMEISGTSNDWTKYSYELSAGTHNLIWRFYKDSSGNSGDDCFYVDDIIIKSGATSWTEYSTTETSITFNNLTSSTSYQVKVKGNCGEEGMSAESDPFSFITDVTCPAPSGLAATNVTSTSAVLNWTGDAESYNVSYYKSYFFESFEEDLSQWTIYMEGDEASWEWAIENPHDNTADLYAHGGDYAAISYSDTNVHADNWLVSPQIQFPNQTTLKFWIMRYTYDDTLDEYEVRLSTTGNAIEDFDVVLKEKVTANPAWTEVVIDLSEYDGQQGYIAIRHDYTGGFFLMVDDFGIYGWSEPIATTDNSLLIEDLLPETEYMWRVQADCGEEGESAWSNIGNFTTLTACPVPFDLNVSEITANGATIAWTGYNESYEVLVGQLETITINYDFEGDTIISDDFTNTSAYPWTVVQEGQDGSYCMKSGNGGVTSSTSAIELTVDIMMDATLSFDFWSRGEGSNDSYDWDKSRFYIDGTRMFDYASHSSWESYSTTLTAGSHTLKWEYKKDGSTNPEGDCFYVDNIIIQSSNVSSWVTYTATESPFILNDATNILPETTYSVKVIGFCEGVATEDSEIITFTTLDENTKIFVIEGDWNDGDNWVPVGVPTIDDDVILRAEATVFDVAEANTIAIDEAGALIIEDGGQLKTNVDVEATMKKFIIGYGTDYVETNNGYYLMTLPTAAPIAAADAGLITEESDFDLYTWDRTATDEEWQNNHDGIDLQNGVGFLYANRDDMEMSFTATLRNSGEPVVVIPAFDDVEHGGWNLCANPFPCEAYITTDAEGMTFYRLVDNELMPIEGAIAPLEAFFVKATAAGQTFTISREAPAK